MGSQNDGVPAMNQSPSQAIRTSASALAAAKQPADGSGFLKATIAASFAPAEWPKTVIHAGSPPYLGASWAAKATAQAACAVEASSCSLGSRAS
jgi:hypothetical protein